MLWLMENIAVSKKTIATGFVVLFMLASAGCMPPKPVASDVTTPVVGQFPPLSSTQPPTPTKKSTARPVNSPTATETMPPVLPPEGILTRIQFGALTVDEYLLDGPPDISTEMLAFGFAAGDKKEILRKTEAYRDYRTQVMQYNNRVLEPFGYSHDRYNIYKSGEVIARHIYWIRPVSVNASQTNFITDVDHFDGGSYILTRDVFEKRTWPPERQALLYVGDQMLSLETVSTDYQQGIFSVYLDDTLAYQSEIHPVSTYATYDGPWSYDNHWAIVLLDAEKDEADNWKQVNRVIVDGQDLNSVYGYQQSFQFTVLAGHPFYFYQKDGKIGISFDEAELPREYDEIPHYYCCSPALLNPGSSMNMIWFFAKRGPNWYYVEAYLPLDTEK